jgi:hypothetical protein
LWIYNGIPVFIWNRSQNFKKPDTNAPNAAFYRNLVLIRSLIFKKLLEKLHVFQTVLPIRIHMFLGLPDPDPLAGGLDPYPDLDPDPSIIMQKY